MLIRLAILALLVTQLACATTTTTDVNTRMNTAADRYVRLVLSLGEHDSDYVDAYYGPPAVREQVKAEKPTLDQIYAEAVDLRNHLASLPEPATEIEKLRLESLRRQTASLIARAEMLRGRKFTFDEESNALYDAVAPTHSEAYFQNVTAQLEREERARYLEKMAAATKRWAQLIQTVNSWLEESQEPRIQVIPWN